VPVLAHVLRSVSGEAERLDYRDGVSDAST